MRKAILALLILLVSAPSFAGGGATMMMMVGTKAAAGGACGGGATTYMPAAMPDLATNLSLGRGYTTDARGMILNLGATGGKLLSVLIYLSPDTGDATESSCAVYASDGTLLATSGATTIVENTNVENLFTGDQQVCLAASTDYYAVCSTNGTTASVTHRGASVGQSRLGISEITAAHPAFDATETFATTADEAIELQIKYESD